MMLFLCFFVGPVQSSVIEWSLWYEPRPRTWLDARDHCKSVHNGDLAAVTAAEVNQMVMEIFYAWIGLRKKGLEWYWHRNNGVPKKVQSQFITPDGNKECGQSVYSTAQPNDEDCESRHFFFCRYEENSTRHTVLIPKTKSWDEAKQYCVNRSYNFATVPQNNDLSWGTSPFYVARNFPVWIGQYQNGSSWQWGNYKTWAPDFLPEVCGFVWSLNKSWSSESCSEALPSLCHGHNLVLIQERLTWEQAFLHCQTLHDLPAYSHRPHQLLSLDPQDLTIANLQALSAQTDKVWLALRFLGESWFWANGEPLSLPDLPLCPEPNLRCGALVVNRNSSKSTIEPADCSETLNLLCYGL